jgi:hypothetical protein
MNTKSQLQAEDRERLMSAMEKNRDGQAAVQCDLCGDSIQLKFDLNGRISQTFCKCGKFNSTFRPV